MGLVKLWSKLIIDKNDMQFQQKRRQSLPTKTTYSLTNRNDSNLTNRYDMSFSYKCKRRVVFLPMQTTCRFLSPLTSSRVNPIHHVPDCRPGHISSYRTPFHVIQNGFCLFFNFLMIYGINLLKQAQILLQQIKSEFEQNPKTIRAKPRVILTISSKHKQINTHISILQVSVKQEEQRQTQREIKTKRFILSSLL